jgi:hypothetical protein
MGATTGGERAQTKPANFVGLPFGVVRFPDAAQSKASDLQADTLITLTSIIEC